MKLCAGAASRRVVEEAARLGVYQIVASRSQVCEGGGYTGLTPESLVEVVHDLSAGRTNVVRDHGGPYQNGDPDDDWAHAFEVDVDAGFDGLHIDVCKLPYDEQCEELERLVQRFADQIHIEIGGERETQEWLNELLDVTLRHARPTYAVIDLGGHVWADRQRGNLIADWHAADITARYHGHGVGTKAHNLDWSGCRRTFVNAVDAGNIAPELGAVEVDAWLSVLSFDDSEELLSEAYKSGRWTRWFNEDEGTWFDRAKCALRYRLEDPTVKRVLAHYEDDGEPFVRHRIRDALEAW